jgi:uncharacterized iron-regulated protein
MHGSSAGRPRCPNPFATDPARKARRLALSMAVAASAALAIGCAPTAPPPLPLPEPEGLVGRIYDVAADAFVTEQELAARLVGPRFVLLGERHDNPHHHVLQARVIELLLASGVRPAVAMEMLSTDRSGTILDCQREPRCSVEEFRHAVEWDSGGWPAWALYQPIFETALSARLRIVAADVPPNAMRVIASSGADRADVRAEWIEALRLDRELPARERSELVREIRDAHCGYLPDEVVPAMVRGQRARDAHLAMATERAAVDKGSVVVLIAGLAHTRTDRGAPFYFTDPWAKNVMLSIGLVEADPQSSSPKDYARLFDGDLPFDIVWFTETVEREDPCEKFRDRLQAIRP